MRQLYFVYPFDMGEARASTDPSTGSGDKPSPNEALERAEEAIRALEAPGAGSDRLPRTVRAMLATVIVGIFGALVIHTFFERDSPKVDETTALLLVLALLVPFLPRLKLLEVAGAKAEWQDQAAIGLKEVVKALTAQHGALTAVFRDLTQSTLIEEQTADMAMSEVQHSVSLRRPVERLMWVDDRPEGSYYEMEGLGSTVDIEVCRTTGEALSRLKQGEVDVVISNVARVEDGVRDEAAGVHLLEAIQRMESPPAVFFYSSSGSRRYDAALIAKGASIVTSSFSEIVSALSGYMAQAFEAAVVDLLAVSGPTELWKPGSGARYDALFTLPDNRRVVVEAVAWRTAPPAHQLFQRMDRLKELLPDLADEAWFVVQRAGILPPGVVGQQGRVRILTFDELRALTASLS